MDQSTRDYFAELCSSQLPYINSTVSLPDGFFSGEEQELIITAHDNGIVCGLSLLTQLLAASNTGVSVDCFLDEGDSFRERMMLLSISGTAQACLSLEPVISGLLGHLSGIATAVGQYKSVIEGSATNLLADDDLFFALKPLERYALTVGGAIIQHQQADSVTILYHHYKPHFGSVAKMIDHAISKDKEKPLIVEVTDSKELDQALRYTKQLLRIRLVDWDINTLADVVNEYGQQVLFEYQTTEKAEDLTLAIDAKIPFISVKNLISQSRRLSFSGQLSK